MTVIACSLDDAGPDDDGERATRKTRRTAVAKA
jgi:hypothetical protein